MYRLSGGSLVASFAWDHYGEPNGPYTLVQDFAPDWMDLAAMACVCGPGATPSGKERAKAAQVVSAWRDQSP